jgi:hypothetical protein
MLGGDVNGLEDEPGDDPDDTQQSDAVVGE